MVTTEKPRVRGKANHVSAYEVGVRKNTAQSITRRQRKQSKKDGPHQAFFD